MRPSFLFSVTQPKTRSPAPPECLPFRSQPPFFAEPYRKLLRRKSSLMTHEVPEVCRLPRFPYLLSVADPIREEIVGFTCAQLRVRIGIPPRPLSPNLSTPPPDHCAAWDLGSRDPQVPSIKMLPPAAPLMLTDLSNRDPLGVAPQPAGAPHELIGRG